MDANNFDARLFRAHVVARLRHIADLFDAGNYAAIQALTFESPAGDGCGRAVILGYTKEEKTW